MQIQGPATATLVLLLCTSTAAAQNSNDWIVIGADAAQSALASLAIVNDDFETQQPGFIEVQTIEQRTVARIDQSVESLVQNVIHTEYHRCGGYTVHPSRESAIAEASNPYYDPEYRPEDTIFPVEINQHAFVRPALEIIAPERIVNVTLLLQELGTRYYESDPGEAAADKLAELWQEYAAGRNDVSIRRHEHPWRQDSVVATIQGTDLSDEIVVIGAHLDSINPDDNDQAPGADDDASGVAVVSEVLRVIIETGDRPRRTLEFMAYAAEEVGLRGSREIAAQYNEDGRQVVAALQMDMTGFKGSAKDMYFISDYTSSDLTNFLKELIYEYNASEPHLIKFGDTKCGYGCSDHVSWTGIGIPAAFPFEARFEDYNEHIHTAQDIANEIDTAGNHQARFAKLGVEYMIELGKIELNKETEPRTRP